MGRTKQLVGWTDGRMDVAPPANQKWTARRHETNSHNFISTLAASESQARQTTVGRPKKRAGEAGGRARQHKYSISPTYCYSNYPLLPSPLPAFLRPPDGWMDGSSMDGRYVGNGRAMGASQVTSSAAAPPSDFS